MFIIIYFYTLIFLFPALLFSYFHFDELEKAMNKKEWKKSGLYKLSREERRIFEQWLVAKEHRYSFSIPKKKKNASWAYVAKKREPYNKEYDPLLFDEKKIPHTLAIFSLFQHEAPYLKEWIEYHRMVGVEHFYLANNLSRDCYLDVLEPYIAKGIVTLIQWPYVDPEECHPYFWCEMQKRAYEMAMQKARGVYRWMAFIDTDEFIVPMKCDTLIDFLSDYEQYAGVMINWLVFGTSFVDKVKPKELLIEKLTKRFPKKHAENNKVKCIVKPHKVLFWPNAHYAEYQPGFFASTPLHQIAPSSQWNKNSDFDTIRIHHYWFRTSDFYWNEKVKRWKTTACTLSHNELKKREEKSNQVTDKTMFRFVKKLKKRMK